MKVGLVVPHIFMHQDILPKVIFSPGELALQLADGLKHQGVDVTLFTPGPVKTSAANITADLSGFEAELSARGDSYIDLLKKHPLIFISLARQVQSELASKAYGMANKGELDVVHVYTNEEDIALQFANLCNKPVVFTHHDPFNLLVKYKHVFPKYKHLNWLSMSYAQRKVMPAGTNWVGNIYHGLKHDDTLPVAYQDSQTPYVAYMGRIIQPKGVHLAIMAVKAYNQAHQGRPYVLRIAGKHYAGQKDAYWNTVIEPQIDAKEIIYEGFIKDEAAKQHFLGGASALLVPSIFEEPFGMVSIEALASGTPVMGLNSGATPEVIVHGKTGFVIEKVMGDKKLNESATVQNIVDAMTRIPAIDRAACYADFGKRFTLDRMSKEHKAVYEELVAASKPTE